jgi:APA family basic amino acid/polyamine antiporter
LFGRPALVWLVDAGGLSLVVGWLMVAISFVILRKKSPAMERPFLLKGGTTIGWIAILMSIGICILYMPGMPSALVWPYEWVIVLVWALLGIVLYKVSMSKYGTANSDAHLNKELDRIDKEK